MRKTALLIAVLSGLMLSGCTAFEKKQQAGAAVELKGHYLYRSTLDSLTLGLSPEDSTRVVQQYTNQWAKDILLYENAKSRPNKAIERLVEDYRRTLYMQAYEAYLVERRMPKSVADSTVEQLYAQMPNRFILDESIVKGMLVVVPVDAPKKDKLKGWMAKREMDAIEKYAYQNAKGYELFDDKWMTATELSHQMPIDRSELENRLRSSNQIEVSDSLRTYLLQVTDKHLRGEKMPMDYARPQIEKIVLGNRQVEFLVKERERLYNEAIQEGEIRFYE